MTGTAGRSDQGERINAHSVHKRYRHERCNNLMHGHIPRVLTTEAPDIDPEARFAAAAESLRATSLEVRQLITRMRESIPVYTEEGGIANAGDTSLVLPPYSLNTIRIGSIWTQGPQDCTHFVLTLGQRVFAWNADPGLVYMQDVGILIYPQDVRRIDFYPASAGGGDVYLEITGRQLPEVNF